MKFWSLLFLAAISVVCQGSSVADESTASDNESIEESCQSYTILGKPDEFVDGTIPGVQLAVRRWTPEADPKAVVVFHHGGAGYHSGYSDIMGSFLQDEGIAVVAYDCMGAGYSTGVDGYRNYFPNITAVADDFTHMLSMVRKEYPTKNVFAMGESFGGMVLTTHILREQRKEEDGILADGYILSAPVIKLLPEMLPPKFALRIVCFLANFFPMLKMPGSDFFSTFDLAFGDQGWAKAGRADPIIQEAAGIPPRLGMAASVLSNMEQMNNDLDQIQVPFKIFLGDKEGRVDTDAIRRYAEVAASKDKELEIVEGGYHQLFQDLPAVTNVVCAHVRDWILQRA